MRKNLVTILVLLVFTFSFYILWIRTDLLKPYFYFSPCDTPLQYKIGSIDSRFGLSKTELKDDLASSESIWENVDKKNLFQYNDKAHLTVNLIYDERQYLSTQINDSKSKVDQEKSSLAPNITDYEEKSREFKERLDALNSKVSYWNDQGGAPPDEYAAIIKEQESLQQLAVQLNQIAEQLNQTTHDVNNQINNLNSTISTYNDVLSKHPEGGLYSGSDDTITLFFNNSKDEVIHTLAHEMGHALGMDHVSDPKGIMYYKTNDSLTASVDDINALTRACQKINIFTIMKTHAQYLWSYFLTSLKTR